MLGDRVDSGGFHFGLGMFGVMFVISSIVFCLKLWACLLLLIIHLQIPLPHHDSLPPLPQLHEHGGPERHEECEHHGEIIVKEVSNIVETAGL